MKLVLVIALISLTVANAFLFRGPTLEDFITGAPGSISGYFTAFFAHFNLKQPNQIIACFDEKSSMLYFKHIDAVSELSQAAENRDHLKVHLIWAKLLLLHKALEPVHHCIGATQDFTDLLNALGAKERNPKLFMLAKYIYYQANFGKLAQELPRITGAIHEKNWNGAGDLAGKLVEVMANDLKTKGLALHALNGLWNGVHIGLGLPDAESVWGCWGNNTAKYRLEFIYSMAAAVADGEWKDAAANTERWYKEKGNDLLRKIPDSNWECWKNSQDTKLESEKLGVDITNEKFYEMVNRFVHSEQKSYWEIQKGIKSSMDDYNFLHAGGAYATLLKAATSQK